MYVFSLAMLMANNKNVNFFGLEWYYYCTTLSLTVLEKIALFENIVLFIAIHFFTYKSLMR